MKIHKRKTLADSYECGECSTIFRKDDLVRTYNKPGLGKYTYQPDVNGTECPFCYEIMDMDTAEIIEYPAPVTRNKEVAGLIKRKYQLETKIEQANSKRIAAEGVGIIDTDSESHTYENGISVRTQRMRQTDGAAVGRRANAQHDIRDSVADLADVEARLQARTTEMPVPQHLPRAKKQDCLSSGVTIKPQIDWDNPLMKVILQSFGIF